MALRVPTIVPRPQVAYEPSPYVPDAYEPSPYGRTIGDLMGMRGQQEADAIRRSGEVRANAWSNVGQIVGQGVQNYQQQKQRDQEWAVQQRRTRQQDELHDLQIGAARRDDNRAKRQEKGEELHRSLAPFILKPTDDGLVTYDRDMVTREMTAANMGDQLPAVMEKLDKADASSRNVRDIRNNAVAEGAYAISTGGNDPRAFAIFIERERANGNMSDRDADAYLDDAQDNGAKAVEKITRSLASRSKEFRDVFKPVELSQGAVLKDPVTGALIAEGNPIPPPPVRLQPQTVMVNGRPVLANFNSATGELTERGSNAPIQNAQPVMPREPREPRAAPEPLMAIIGDDGKPVYVPRSQAIGRAPASTREQGRPVSSSDAGRYTDLDSSLDEITAVRTVISGVKGATGTKAAIQAGLPNWANEALGGWGTEAKTKQAVIDRVKQVIGKALEEGVLHKEDEKKYKKILPIISDPDEVVVSKLNGLEAAIVQRRQRHSENLSSAGYDTTGFQQRQSALTGQAPVTAAPIPGGPKDGDTKEVPGYPGTVMTFGNGRWTRTK